MNAPAGDGVTTTMLESEPADRFQSIRRELGVTSFGINQIVLAPGQRMRIHLHRHQEEVYLVLDGTLTLLVEGEPRDIEAGEVVRVPPSVRRQLVNGSRERVALLALGGRVEHEHQGRDAEAFTGWDQADGAEPRDVPYPEDLPASELS